MRKTYTLFLLAALVLTLMASPVLAAAERAKDDIEVAIYTCAAKVCDFVIIGMKADATDGRDNKYDGVSPGLGMSDSYVSMVIPHPDWTDVKTDYRTDFRSVKKSDTWEALVNTNLPDGTPLTMSINWERTKLPANFAVMVEDMATGAVTAIDKGEYVFPVKTSGIARRFLITIEKEKGKEHR